MNIEINNIVLKPYDQTYYISNKGDVYSLYSKKFLKWSIDKDGYPRVDIHRKHIKVHILVYLVWGDRDLQGLQVNHRDDNKLNPSIENLYLGTQKDNIRDCISNGHMVGNRKYLTVIDKQKNKLLTFSPVSEFIDYCGHPSRNGSVKKMFNKNWFRERYIVIDYNNVGSVTTNPDECKGVA